MPSRGETLAVRLTDDAWQNLRGACLRGGLTNHSALEAAAELVALFSVSPEERQRREPELAGPVLEEVVTVAWEVVKRLEDRHRFGRERRHKVAVRTDLPELPALRDALRESELSMNAVLASVFTPWGSRWGSTEAYALRRELWERAAARARIRDYFRRRPTEAGGTSDAVLQFGALRMSPGF